MPPKKIYLDRNKGRKSASVEKLAFIFVYLRSYKA
jgi:hypothetical protein